MKKSEFKKLKVGDTVQLRTLEELKQLNCYSVHGVKDDDGFVWWQLTQKKQEFLGRKGVVTYHTNTISDVMQVEINGEILNVVRQHLKGRE